MGKRKPVSRRPRRRPLSRRQFLRALGRLLCMEYRPSELAEEVGCDLSTVYRSFIPAGCPHRRDRSGHYWIVGTEFRDWAQRIMKRERRKMKAGEAFCFKCNRPVPMQNPTVQPSNRVLQLTTGTCPICGNTVNRGGARRDQRRLPDDSPTQLSRREALS